MTVLPLRMAAAPRLILVRRLENRSGPDGHGSLATCCSVVAGEAAHIVRQEHPVDEGCMFI